MSAGRFAFGLFFLVWAGLWLWSFSGFLLLAPEGDGFTRGMNRVTHFLGWQFAAALVGALIWGFAGVWPKGSVGRWIGRAPVALGAALLAALIALFLYANFVVRAGAPDTSDAKPPPGPVTAAASDAIP